MICIHVHGRDKTTLSSLNQGLLNTSQMILLRKYNFTSLICFSISSIPVEIGGCGLGISIRTSLPSLSVGSGVGSGSVRLVCGVTV